MPVRKKYRKRRRRRTYKRKRRGRRKPRLGFPITMTARCRQAGSITLDAQAGTLAHYKLCCNMVHMPDGNLPSKQPRHYGIYADIYNKYKVLGAKLTIRPTGPTSTQVNTQAFGIMINESGTIQAPNTQLTHFLEDPKIFGRSRLTRRGIAETRPLTSKWSIKRLSGEKQGSDDVLDGSTGNSDISAAGPSRKEYFTIWAGRAGLDVTDPVPINFTYTIEYIVKFFDFNDKLPVG